MRIALVCEGNPSTSETAFSGTAKRMFLALRSAGHQVIPVDASLSPLWRAVAALITFSLDRTRWRARFRYANTTCKFRARAALASLGDAKVDVILQIGATFDPPLREPIPYAIFCDWNMELHAREPAGPTGLRSGLNEVDLESIRSEHRRRYESSAAIFTISERLRQSFLEFYALSPERVHTAYAGPNFDESFIEKARAQPRLNEAPTVLFVAKEFLRKGGATVAESFQRVRQTIPDARLLFAGTTELPAELAGIGGVEHLGLLDKNEPAQLQKLLNAYRESDLLVLPSRRDPFPTVIREAMFFGLPCVVSNIWAMAEMVVEGESGFLVSPGDVDALTQRITVLLSDEQTRTQFGRAALQRAEKLFTWKAVEAVLSKHLQSIISRPETKL